MDVDETGEGTAVHVHRALVRSRAKLDYVSSQTALDDGSAAEQLRLLRKIGILREQREARRGGVSLALPEQLVTHEDERYGLRFRAPLPIEVKQRFQQQYGLRLQEGYGLTETSPLATIQRPSETAKAGTIGKPIFGVELKIVDDNDNEVKQGERGESRDRES